MPPSSPPAPVLLRLLTTAGYRIQVRGDASVAVRLRDRRAVVLAAATRSPGELEGLFPGDAVQRTIVYDDDPGPVARTFAADRGIEILDPGTLGPALGELLLPSPQSSSENHPDGPTLETPFSVLPEGNRIVRPRIGRVEAELLVGAEGPRFTLRLVPFYVAPYRVRPASPYGEAGKILDRTVAVHGVSGEAEVWEDGDRELVGDLEIPHQFVAPEVSVAQASGFALEEIRRHHTIHVDHTEQHGGALVIETRRVPPAADDVRIGPLQLIYLPHWYAEGSQGRVVLDAVTGRRNLAALPSR
ncbi:MAG: hypothetical protein L3K02_08295 [Thermoplasmata archaeon]|nr:hypothetical protein [Thermoplasmata archaeon]